MKNTRSITSLMAVAMVFALVLSCDEHDERMEVRNLQGPTDTKKNDGVNRMEEVNWDGSEGDPLDLTTAREWAANFRSESARANEIRAHYFGFEIIQGILNQAGCVGIRIYYALDENGEKKLLVVGVDQNGNDLLPEEGGKSTEGGYTIADFSLPCPNYCSGGGGL